MGRAHLWPGRRDGGKAFDSAVELLWTIFGHTPGNGLWTLFFAQFKLKSRNHVSEAGRNSDTQEQQGTFL